MARRTLVSRVRRLERSGTANDGTDGRQERKQEIGATLTLRMARRTLVSRVRRLERSGTANDGTDGRQEIRTS